MFCKQPDRDEPRLKCGYPLPCPHHTLIADIAQQTVTAPLGQGATVTVPAEQAGRVGQITRALKSTRRRRK